MNQIIDICTQDHRRIQEIVATALRHLDEGRALWANREMASLGRRLSTHLQVEERMVFPRFGLAADDFSRGLVGDLRKEHTLMREVLSDASESLADGDLRNAASRL